MASPLSSTSSSSAAVSDLSEGEVICNKWLAGVSVSNTTFKVSNALLTAPLLSDDFSGSLRDPLLGTSVQFPGSGQYFFSNELFILTVHEGSVS